MRETPRGAPIMRDGTISATRDKVDRSTVELLTVCVSNSLGTSPRTQLRTDDAKAVLLDQRHQFEKATIIRGRTLLIRCRSKKLTEQVAISMNSLSRFGPTEYGSHRR